MTSIEFGCGSREGVSPDEALAVAACILLTRKLQYSGIGDVALYPAGEGADPDPQVATFIWESDPFTFGVEVSGEGSPPLRRLTPEITARGELTQARQ